MTPTPQLRENYLPNHRKTVLGYKDYLAERQYRLPANGSQAMFDVYALYALWWDIGRGKGDYGYQDTKIVPQKRAERVNRTFEEAVYTLGKRISEFMIYACYEEALTAEEDDIIPSEVVANYVKSAPVGGIKVNPTGASERDLEGAAENQTYSTWIDEPAPYEISVVAPTAEDLVTLFQAPFWADYTKIKGVTQYGGEKWVKMVELAQELLGAIKTRSKSAADVMGIIDKIYDAHHNTGSLFNKDAAAQFNLTVSQSDLDIRARLRKPSEFVPYVSKPVAELIQGSRLHVESEADSYLEQCL